MGHDYKKLLKKESDEVKRSVQSEFDRLSKQKISFRAHDNDHLDEICTFLKKYGKFRRDGSIMEQIYKHKINGTTYSDKTWRVSSSNNLRNRLCSSGRNINIVAVNFTTEELEAIEKKLEVVSSTFILAR